MNGGPLQPSGRVIASGRLLLACVFLIAIWTDRSQPTYAILPTYALLSAYLIWSLGVTFIVWKSWWLDARLAAPAHVVDVAVFMLTLYSTSGYSSPYFTFFIFILLAAAIRWGWKETAVTAFAITAVYLSAGWFLAPSPQGEMERFILRTGNLLIISAILIWFGASQWVPWRYRETGDPPEVALHGDGFIAALQVGMAAAGARRGLMLWHDVSDPELELVRITPKEASRSGAGPKQEVPGIEASLLFDLRGGHVLMNAAAGRWRFLRAPDALPASFADLAGPAEGLAIPIATGTIEGVAILQDIRALSTDHLDIAPRIARELAVRIQEAALFAAVEERSMAKARVAVARDLHDSVVQFLAGLGFRLEALKRLPKAESELAQNIAELKDTVMTEQRQLRAFIKGLRTGKPISLSDLTRDCASLCKLLSRQWSVDCRCACNAETGFVPLRTQLDFQHLVREAVANAVRHGNADQIIVAMQREDEHLRLTITDNGVGFSSAAQDPKLPASLNARVREARGELEVQSAPGETMIVIRLPLEDDA